MGVWDVYERQGVLVPEGSALPIVPGSDGAGTVISAGSKVSNVAVGDLVYVSATTRPKGGFYAEYAAVKAQYAARVPDGVPAEHAGAMPTDALTALAGLDTVSLSTGDWLLIFGASGGQGHLAVQLAKRQGLNVIAVASGADGVALVTRLGADVSLDGHGDMTDVLARIRDAAPDGVKAILAMAGGATLDRLTEALADGGSSRSPTGCGRSRRNGRASRCGPTTANRAPDSCSASTNSSRPGLSWCTSRRSSRWARCGTRTSAWRPPTPASSC